MKKIRTDIVFITLLLSLLPVIIGVLLWNRLPEQIPTHFGFDGNADGYSGKACAVFGLPMLLVLLHLIILLIPHWDPKAKNISPRIHMLALWIVPMVSVFICVLTYPSALGYQMNANIYGSVLLGVILIVVGNYLPKCRQNYTIGIRLPWTLADEENWNRTHRMAGPVWMIAGLIVLISSMLLPEPQYVMAAVIAAVAAVPTVYSFLLHRKKAGKE